MGFTTQTGRVRIDLFKESGKWYATGSVNMGPYYKHPGGPHEAVLSAARDEARKLAPTGEWPISNPPDAWLGQGGTIVCLEPFHEQSFPVQLKRKETP